MIAAEPSAERLVPVGTDAEWTEEPVHPDHGQQRDGGQYDDRRH